MARGFDIRPLDGVCFGAVVTGVKLTSIDDATLGELRKDWVEYGLLVFPGQFLSNEQQIAFAKRLGPLEFEMAALSNVKADGTLRREEDNDDRMKVLKGNMGWHHARVLSLLKDAELVGVADPDPKRGQLAVEQFGCQWFASYEEMLGQVEAVCIAVPTLLHHRVGMACFNAGVHVLIEKPIAASQEEAAELIRAADAAGRLLQVGHIERFNPAVQAIKNAIEGESILSIAITRVGPFPPRMSNVGVVIDLAVHDIDLIRWFTDSDIVDVQPQTSNAVAEREDIALLQFRTASGVLAHINTNWLTPFKARNVTVATRGKYVMGDLLTRQVTECFGFQPDGSYSMRHLSVGHDEPLRAELTAFINAVRDSKAPPVTGEQAVASLEIAIRCLEERPTPIAASLRKGPRRIVG